MYDISYVQISKYQQYIHIFLKISEVKFEPCTKWTQFSSFFFPPPLRISFSLLIVFVSIYGERASAPSLLKIDFAAW